jgi:hypothetical protein
MPDNSTYLSPKQIQEKEIALLQELADLRVENARLRAKLQVWENFRDMNRSLRFWHSPPPKKT